MLPKPVKVAFALIACVLLFGSGHMVGLKQGMKAESASHYRFYAGLLRFNADACGEQLREFAKARYYHLARFISDGQLGGNDMDYGPIQREALGAVPVGKGDFTPESEYKQFQGRVAEVRASVRGNDVR